MGPGAVPLDVHVVDAGTGAVGAGAVADTHDVVFRARDSLCRVRRRMSRRLQRVTRSATMAGSVVAVIRSFLSL